MSTQHSNPYLSNLLPPPLLSSLTLSWLHEDTPHFDPAAILLPHSPVTANLYLKSPAVLSGRPFVDALFAHLDLSPKWKSHSLDGTSHTPPSKLLLATITGPPSKLLLAERPALNAYAECSAVATLARQVVSIAENHGWKGRVAGTRKTTPGFRIVQKYGMIVGGMDPHRMDLSSMIMLKDNHINVAGSITTAVQTVKRVAGFSVLIDVECSTVQDAYEAADAGAGVVMLDNFGPDAFKQAARKVKERYPNVLVEGSGGITKKSIADYMCDEADVLSFSINRYVTPVDMSMKIESST